MRGRGRVLVRRQAGATFVTVVEGRAQVYAGEHKLSLEKGKGCRVIAGAARRAAHAAAASARACRRAATRATSPRETPVSLAWETRLGRLPRPDPAGGLAARCCSRATCRRRPCAWRSPGSAPSAGVSRRATRRATRACRRPTAISAWWRSRELGLVGARRRLGRDLGGPIGRRGNAGRASAVMTPGGVDRAGLRRPHRPSARWRRAPRPRSLRAGTRRAWRR